MCTNFLDAGYTKSAFVFVFASLEFLHSLQVRTEDNALVLVVLSQSADFLAKNLAFFPNCPVFQLGNQLLLVMPLVRRIQLVIVLTIHLSWSVV